MNTPLFVTVGDLVALNRPVESFAHVGALPAGTLGFVHGLAGRFAQVEFVNPDGETLADGFVDWRVLHVVDRVEGEPFQQIALEALYLVGQLYYDNRQLQAAATNPLAPSRLAGRPQFEQVSFETMTPDLTAALAANGYAKVSQNATGEPEIWARLRSNGKG